MIYREVQRFRHVGLWLLLSALPGFALYLFVQQILLGHPVGDRPMSDTGAWIIIGLLCSLTALFVMLHLKVEVDSTGVSLRYFPFLRRRYLFSDIRQVEACTYQPLRDFGGWGIRRGNQGWAYTVSGKEGVALTLTDGKWLLIGSRRAQELAKIIQSHLK